MVVINKKLYETYYDVCIKFGINLTEFSKYHRENSDLGEFDLLKHFIPELELDISNGHYFVK